MSDEFSVYNISNKRILIKTFLFESGLWYLAKSLGDILSANGNYVCYIPKAKYSSVSGSFKRGYPDPRNKSEFSDINIESFGEKASVGSQILRAVKKHNAELIISFETLMQAGQWINEIKNKTGVEVYDVPMSEWVTPSFVSNDAYKVFDKIISLTDTCKKAFSGYKNCYEASWDIADSKLFFPPQERSINLVTFYHQATTNPDCSNKNTAAVIEAFLRLSKIERNTSVELIITGVLSNEEKMLCSGVKNILIINGFLDKWDISEIYKKAHCVVAPSLKEGLGLSFYESSACGCRLITTDVDPMNKHSAYLCRPSSISHNKSGCLVPTCVTSAEEILRNLEIAYKEILMSSKVKDIKVKKKVKTLDEIGDENDALMAAFSDDDSEAVNKGVLEKLKEKSRKKTKIRGDNMPVVVDDKNVSINFAVIGVGQAGSRIAEEFHKLGYDVGVVNTSAQDLEYIDVLDNQKLLLEGTLGGTGKDLDLGREMFVSGEADVLKFVNGVVEGNDMVYLAASGGGGTGASSVDTVVPMLFNTGMPVGVIFVLPKATEDAQSKRNAIESLSRLARMAADNLISNLVVVDNARIEQIYANLSQSKFWNTANKAIVSPIHIFNSLTSRASMHTSLDPSDFGKIISCGDCSVYGLIEVDDYMEETALAESVIDSLGSNMLASGFDLTQARVGGVIITGSKEVLDKLPAININYCFHMISDQTNGASIFQGIYDVESESDSVKIYAWFAGLGLPQDRVDNLKRESESQSKVAAEKEKMRSSMMTLDLEEDNVSNVTQEVNRKIRKKKSGFNKLQKTSRSSIIDRRKRK